MTHGYDRRFWVLNPTGHRLTSDRQSYGRDGEEINTPFGKAALIVLPSPPAAEWYCDLCSEQLLTKWGDEPWPVAMIGSYALCPKDMYQIMEQNYVDQDSGEELPFKMGEWPAQICTCQPCDSQMQTWLVQLHNAYITPDTAISG